MWENDGQIWQNSEYSEKYGEHMDKYGALWILIFNHSNKSRASNSVGIHLFRRGSRKKKGKQEEQKDNCFTHKGTLATHNTAPLYRTPGFWACWNALASDRLRLCLHMLEWGHRLRLVHCMIEWARVLHHLKYPKIVFIPSWNQIPNIPPLATLALNHFQQNGHGRPWWMTPKKMLGRDARH